MHNPATLFRTAAILGAGVMGAQIAAHLANAGLSVRLFELAGNDADPSQPAREAIARLAKLKPAPLADPSLANAIEPCNYDEHLDRLRECDLVIEVIAERPDLKHALYARIAPFLAPHAVLATNTSGLPIGLLAKPLDPALAARFVGVHFFNPPRHLPLVELIAHRGTDPEVLDRLEGFLVTGLGKNVVRAKDTPAFIGNRIGVFAMLSAMHHAERLGLPLDLVDRLTGTGIGRPKSATFRTADLVGLDTLKYVVEGSRMAFAKDPWIAAYRLPEWMERLIAAGALGEKKGAGVYRKGAQGIEVVEPRDGQYRRVRSALDPAVRTFLDERDPARKFAQLETLDHPQGEFLRAHFADLFHYSAAHLDEIADSAREVDLAMRWGFGWRMGPFEMWQAAGWAPVRAALERAIAAGQTLSSAPLPAWVAALDASGPYTAEGAWAPREARFLPRRPHPVYRRQRDPERVPGEARPSLARVWENAGVRLSDLGEGVAGLTFRTRMHTVDEDILDGVQESLLRAGRDFGALVIHQIEPPFSAGANLLLVLGCAMDGEFDRLCAVVRRFQDMNLALRDAPLPVVAAVDGLALGGGCEILLHCDRVVASLESYIGLVEVGVGVIPGAGGCKELARRAAAECDGPDPFARLARYFEQVAYGKVSGSAHEARSMGYLGSGDAIVMHPAELLHAAHAHAKALIESGYRPPRAPREIVVCGRAGMANIEARLVNLREGGFISAHDLTIARALARVLCGGEVEEFTSVSERWLLDLELDAFMELVRIPKTLARIEHMLQTGKPLRN